MHTKNLHVKGDGLSSSGERFVDVTKEAAELKELYENSPGPAATAVGVNRSQIVRWWQPYSTAHLWRIAKATGRPIQYFFPADASEPPEIKAFHELRRIVKTLG